MFQNCVLQSWPRNCRNRASGVSKTESLTRMLPKDGVEIVWRWFVRRFLNIPIFIWWFWPKLRIMNNSKIDQFGVRILSASIGGPSIYTFGQKCRSTLSRAPPSTYFPESVDGKGELAAAKPPPAPLPIYRFGEICRWRGPRKCRATLLPERVDGRASYRSREDPNSSGCSTTKIVILRNAKKQFISILL